MAYAPALDLTTLFEVICRRGGGGFRAVLWEDSAVQHSMWARCFSSWHWGGGGWLAIGALKPAPCACLVRPTTDCCTQRCEDKSNGRTSSALMANPPGAWQGNMFPKAHGVPDPKRVRWGNPSKGTSPQQSPPGEGASGARGGPTCIPQGNCSTDDLETKMLWPKKIARRRRVPWMQRKCASWHFRVHAPVGGWVKKLRALLVPSHSSPDSTGHGLQRTYQLSGQSAHWPGSATVRPDSRLPNRPAGCAGHSGNSPYQQPPSSNSFRQPPVRRSAHG